MFTVEKTYMQKNSEKKENYPYSNYIIMMMTIYAYICLCVLCKYVSPSMYKNYIFILHIFLKQN